MISDARLIERCKGGDQLAWEALFARYRGLIYVLAESYYLPRQDRADVLQEARLAVFGAVNSWKPERGSGFKSFLCMCVRSRLDSAVKGATRGKHGPLNHADDLDAPRTEDGGTLAEVIPGGVQPEEVVERAAELAELIKRINELTELERDMLIEVVFCGRSYEELAAANRTTTKRVDNAIQRARKKLKAASG